MGGVSSVNLNGNLDNSNSNNGFRPGVLLMTKTEIFISGLRSEELYKKNTGELPVLPKLQRKTKGDGRTGILFNISGAFYYFVFCYEISFYPKSNSRIQKRPQKQKNQVGNIQFQSKSRKKSQKYTIISPKQNLYTLTLQIFFFVGFQKKIYLISKFSGSHTPSYDIQYIVGKITKKSNQNLWYLKIDISKYFYSINHNMLKQKISKYIKNSDVLYAIHLVIDSYQTSSIFDSLFTLESDYRQTKAKGLPIGALYSQLFANFYLSEIDRYIVQQLKPQIYARYMDDFVFLDTKENLQKIKLSVIKKIENHKLIVVPKKTQTNTLNHGLSFLGFKIQAVGSKLQIFVNSKNKKKFRKSVDKINSLNPNGLSRQDQKRILSVFQSRKGIFKHTGNTQKYFRNLKCFQ